MNIALCTKPPKIIIPMLNPIFFMQSDKNKAIIPMKTSPVKNNSILQKYTS
ncbi:hypothetical protein [Intestinibacter bartlettii]|uniref:hypothetical protein n=1 Tax=Intestinibacter bartlettii TaxID=261299 RepID=UPI0012E79DD3